MGDPSRGVLARAVFRARHLLCGLLFVLASLFGSAPARAESCPADNVLGVARVLGGAPREKDAKLLTDRKLVREGSPWPAPSAVVVLREPLVFDLGSVMPLRQVYVQVDADQSFGLELSTDGSTFTRLSVGASSTASGLVSRSFNLGSAEARFVRLVPTSDPPSLTLSELAVACQRDTKLKRGMTSVDAPRDSASSWVPRLLTALTGLPVISPEGATYLKIAAVVVALALLGIELKRRRRYVAVWALLGALSVGAYLNLGSYRYPDFIHDHDVFHYFVGAKYFPELGYDKIYDCSAVAEAEAGFEQRVRLRAQRDLRDNAIVPGARVLARAAACHDRFTPERWRAFRQDVAYFANGRSVEDWHRVLKDHGFNATPTWIALARAISADLPADEGTIGHQSAMFAGEIGPLDPLLLLLALAALYWAFGLRTAALVAIAFACNPLSEFAWVGGGFLREAWLASLAIGIALLRKRFFVLGGVALALSGLLQMFPIISVGGALLAALVFAFAQTRSALSQGAAAWSRAALHELWSRQEVWRLLVGAVLTVAVLVPVSGWGSGAPHAWSAFATNTAKHAATPSGNLVGLGSLLSFRPSTNIDVLFDPNADDPFERARAARLETRSAMRPIQALLVIGALGVLALGLRRRRELWWAAALGLCLVPLTLETSCYYAAWFCVFALVTHDDDRLGLPVLSTLLGLLIAKLAVRDLGPDVALATTILLVGLGAVLWLIRSSPARPSAVREE